MVRKRKLSAAIQSTALALIAAMFLLVGCAGDGNAPEPQNGSDAASPAETAKEAEPDKIVSLGFIGDICLADNYIPMQHLAERNSTSIYDGIDSRYIKEMRAVDLMWANNEFAYGTDVEPLEGKEWTFLAAPANVKYLKDLGVDVAGLANNHVFDYGEEAFNTTLDTLKDAGIPSVGAGRNIQEAAAPVIIERNGVRIAYVAASCAEYTIYTPEAGEDTPGIMWCYDDDKFLEAIRNAASQADFVVALPHWGVEHSTELESKQVESARAYIDAGADAVVGAHAHILQGIDFYEGKPILYNLGNFWFDGYDIDTVMAELVVDASGDTPKVEVVLLPGTQSGAFTAWAPNDSERERIFAHIEEISDGAVSIDDAGHVSAS